MAHLFVLRKLLHGGSTDDGDDDGDAGTDPSGLDTGSSSHGLSTLQSLKIASFFIVPICTFAGAIPALIRSRRLFENSILLSYLNTISGSILLGFGFLHILPDAVESFNPYIDRVRGFPLIYALALVGFFCVLVLEKALLTKVEAARARHRVAAADNTVGTIAVGEAEKPSVELELAKQQQPSGSGCGDGHGHPDACAFHSHNVVVATDAEGAAALPWFYSPLFLAMGLSFHSIFEGLALGLQRTTHDFVLLLIGIALHKWAEAFALSVNVAKAGVSVVRSIVIVVVFSLVCPIGIGIGFGMDSSLNETAQNIAAAVLQGLAVGVFLHITILGVVVEEFSGGQRLVQKFALALIGCAAMGCLSFFE